MLKRVLSIVVTVALLLTMACFAAAESATALSVAVDKADLRPGDKVTATVQLNNYGGNWSAMSIDVTYNSALFDLAGELETSVRYSYFTAGLEDAVSEVYQPEPGLLRFVWMDLENISFSGSTLVEIDLVAKEVSDSSSISAQFAADGQISTDGEGLPTQIVAGADTFSADKASSEPVVIDGVAWDEQPTIRLDLNGNDRMQVKREYDVFVYVDKYIPWNQLSVDLSMQGGDFANYLKIVDVEPLGFAGNEPVVDGSNITITAGSNVAGGVQYLVDGSLKAFKVTLSPIDDIASATLVAAFAEGGQQEATLGPLRADVHYRAAANEQAIKLVPDMTGLSVTIVDDEGNEKTSWNAGEEFNVLVSLKDHANAWAAFTLVGTYDPDLFEVVDIDTESYKEALGQDQYENYYTVVEPEKLTDDLEIVWISAGNIPANPENINPVVMKIRFKALGAVDSESISFAFKEGGVVAEDENGVLQNQTSGSNFTDTPATGTVTVAPTPMKVITTVEGDVSGLKAGKTFSVKVSIKDYYEDLAALSLKSAYDSANFELVGVQSLLTFGEGGEFITPDIDAINGGEEDLDLVWISAENVDLPADFEAAVLTFRAKQAVENATVDVEFLRSGILRVDENGMPEDLVDEEGNSAYFTAENDPAVVTVAPAKVLLEVVTDAEDVMAGDEFNVEVYVIDYYSPLAAISVEGTLDEKFEVLSYTAEILDNVEPVQDEDGELQFVWASAENIETGEQRFKVLTLRVKALQSTTAEDVIAFNFINGGMVRVDGTGNVSGLTAGTDYADPANPADNEEAIINVPVAKRPVQLIATPQTAGTVEAGKTFDVIVSISDFYEGDWSSLGIWANFDSADFVVENATTDPNFDGVFSWTLDNENSEEPKPFVAGWVALNNVAEFPAMTVTFRAKEDAVIDDAMEQIDFYFASNAINTCVDYDAMNYAVVDNTDDCAYESEAVPIYVNITAPDATVQYELSWGDLEFSYEFGTWDVENHEWTGAGWICEEGADEITVENTGSVGFNAGFEFTKNGESLYDLTNLTGSFTHEDAPLEGQITIAVGQPAETVLFALNGRTEQVWDDQQTIGSITVTITADGAIDEEVTQ